MNLGEMMEEVSDNVRLAGLEPPAAARLVRLLNIAKTKVASAIEMADSELMAARTVVNLTAGQTSFALPPQRVRVIGLQRTDMGEAVDVPIIDARETGRRSDDAVTLRMNEDLGWNTGSAGLRVYFEGDTAYVESPSGAPQCTLLLRTRNRVADLSETQRGSSFGVPEEYHPLIVCEASAAAIPASNEEYGKHRQEANYGYELLRRQTARRTANRPISTLDRSPY